MNIIPELNLNKHPKDCKNFSLVNAKNIKISDDLSCIQNENILENNTILTGLLNGKTLLGVIQCNTELVLFVTDTTDTSIYRYNEKDNTLYLCGKLVSNNNDLESVLLTGKIIGTFTYNVNEDLIIAFSELDANKPVNTINLGKIDDSDYDISRADIFIDSDEQYIDNSKISLCPEVQLPNIMSINYTNGKTYKGWYHFFIRYKINKVDYTQWFPIGYPILIDSLKKQNIIKYSQCVYYLQDPDSDFEYQRVAMGCNDSFNDTLDISEETINFALPNLDIRYNKYQIGFICSSSVYQKAFKTYDIDINNSSVEIDIKLFEETSMDELLVNTYNYYNVKNIINYKNRLYIANYKEHTIEEDLSSIVDDITLDLVKTYSIDDSIREASNDIGKEIYDIDEESQDEFTIPANASLYSSVTGIITVGQTIPLLNDTQYYHIFDDDSPAKQHISYKILEARLEDHYEFYVWFLIGNTPYIYRIEGEYAANNTFTITYIYNPFLNDVTYSPTGTITNKIKYINTDKSFENRRLNKTLIPGGVYSFYIHFVDKYGIATDGYKLNTVATNSILTTITNVIGDTLFKIPFEAITTENGKYKYPKYNLKVNVTDIPDGYVGYYLSYEKYENNMMPGILCIGDINDAETEFTEKTFISNSKMHFYSAELNNDKITLDYTKLRVINNNIFDDFTTTNKEQNDATFEFYTNLNTPQLNFGTTNAGVYDISGLKYKLGGDPKSGRNGKGTCIEMNIIDSLFTGTGAAYNVYKVLLEKDDTKLYLNSNKELIKFSNIYYNTGLNTITEGYNGCLTFNNFLVYDLSGVKFDTYNRASANKARHIGMILGLDVYADKYIIGNPTSTLVGESVEYDVSIIKFLGYSQVPFITNKFYETKEFNNEPQIFIYNDYQPEYPEKFKDTSTIGCFVLPQNSIDLFKDRFGSQDDFNPVVEFNYNPDVYHLNEFDKTVRRSKIIADETSENSWRIFPVEGYKQISENKGIITNLVGFGNTLLVHTEHSLFAFISNSKMQTMENRTIQLEIPDIFDIDYQEVFTSSLGSCGLQDKFAAIADDFGYFFYDNDAHRLYRYGQNSIEEIDTTIINFLNKYKPNKVRFGLDRESTRILLCLDFNNPNSIGQLTLSYNYKIKSFISAHSYNFIDSYFTKNKGYFITSSAIKQFNYNNLTNINYAQSFKFNIICNTDYDIIKVLEYIQYKLYKVEILNGDYESDPVEGNGGQRKVPYSGYKLRIYNDLIDTDEIDITTNITIPRPTSDNANNYKKPYFYLGNWNFNYLRDDDTVEHSRLHGNYYIISFIFEGNNTKQRIEFESIMCNLIRNL